MFNPEFLHYPGSHEFSRDYMALFSDSIMADREGERELARRKRQAQIDRQLKAEKLQEAEQSFTPIFSAPVRTQHVDETAMRVLNTLGEFSHVERDLNDSSAQKFLLGIPKQPMTPLPSDGKQQGRLFPQSSVNSRICPNALSKVMQQNEMQDWRSGQSKLAANSSEPKNDKASANYASSKQGNERQKTTSEKYKTNGSSAKGSNRGHARSRTKSSAADAKSGESHSGPPNGAVYGKVKKEPGARYKPDSSRTGVDGAGAKKPDSNNLFETVAKQQKSMFDSDEEDFPSGQKQKKEKLKPRLDIPIKTEPNSSNQEKKVENILSIMTDIKSPVTAIQTPIKETSKFLFGMVDKVKGLTSLTPIQEVKAVAPLNSTTKSQRLPDAVTFQASDDEGGSDEEDVNKNRKDAKESMTPSTIGKTTNLGNLTEGELDREQVSNTGTMERISDSSSESSSSESEGSGSEDSDSENDSSGQESEEDEKPTKPKYGLSKIIADVKNEKSPVTPNMSKSQFGSSASAPGSSPTPSLSSRTPSHGDSSFSSKTTSGKSGSKHGENSSGFGMEMNFVSSKYSGNFDKYSDGNENKMDDFKKLTKESKLDKRTPKPTAKPKGAKKIESNSLKSTPSAKNTSLQVKGDGKKEKSSKAKMNRQSSKTDSKPKNSAKSTKGDKKSLPKSNERRGKNKSPKSREFVPSDSSDSEEDSPRINKLNSKGNNKPNSVYPAPVSSVDDVFITISPPILSPLKSPDLSSDIVYNKSGIPSSLVVRFDLNDIENLPGKVRTPHRTCSPRSKRGEDIIDSAVDEKPPMSYVKGKRKSEEVDSETFSTRGDSHKKPKTENSSKSPRSLHVLPIKEEPLHNESVIPDSDTVLDRRRPYERRGSVTSISSHHSSSGSSHKSDKDHPPSKRRKHSGTTTTDIVKTNLNINSHSDWLQHDERTEMRDPSQTQLTTDVMYNRNPHKNVDETEWVVDGGFSSKVLPDSRHRQSSYQDERCRQLTSDDYLNEGKKLKRLADAQSDKNVKALTYFDAVLSFILCGHTMEINPDGMSVEKAVTMYNETCEIIKFILKFKGTHQDAAYTDKKLQVLCHRCQALLYTRMFKLKKTAAMKMSRALSEHFKSQNKSQQGAQAPSPWNSTKYTGTPSPMSPTPSPAGSVGSCGSMGSQGSNNCSDLSSNQNYSSQNKYTNGITSAPMSSPAPVIQLPQRIINMMSGFLVFSNYSLFGLDFWEQSEEMAKEHPEFFQELDQQCGPLTLHSSTLELVRYARNGLHKLKKS